MVNKYLLGSAASVDALVFVLAFLGPPYSSATMRTPLWFFVFLVNWLLAGVVVFGVVGVRDFFGIEND